MRFWSLSAAVPAFLMAMTTGARGQTVWVVSRPCTGAGDFTEIQAAIDGSF